MKFALRRRVAACLCLAGAMLASTAVADDEDAKALTPRMLQTRRIVEGMLDPRGFRSMTLAPDGKHIAAIASNGKTYSLVLIDADTMKARMLVAPRYLPNWTAPIQPLSVHWISAETMAVDFNDGNASVVGFDGYRGLVLGDHFLRMIAPDKPGAPARWALVGEQGAFQTTHVRRVDVVTGEKIDVPVGLPGDLLRVVFDRAGRLRAATTSQTKWFVPGAQVTNWYRHDDQSPWQQVAQVPLGQDLWVPIGVAEDADTLVVLSREGRDTWAMFDYDVATRHLADLLVGHPTEDLTDTEPDINQEFIRATANGLKPATYWFDARWDQLQRSVDKALPDTVNVLSGDPQGRVLVFSYSDRDPGQWRLLDTANWSLRHVSASRMGIDPAAMRPMQTLTYAADDGMQIPAYLTVPAGPAVPRPMVVYIHGGPAARDEWGWDFDVQVLAAAGYAVFQPQFRGSSGFGRKFEQAGIRQWGLAMQDDITAGVKAMIARGIADPARICTYGGSYGGYAALWGLVKTPDLYRCGISLAGVTDIGERFSDWSDTNSTKEGREELRLFVGDMDTMAGQFDAVSPEKHAAQIHVPVLLAHGTDDRRVPIGHAKRMAAALRAAHGSVETHWYSDEGHGLGKVGDLRDFETALLDFLDRNIGPASNAAAAWQPVPAAAAVPAVPAASAALP